MRLALKLGISVRVLVKCYFMCNLVIVVVTIFESMSIILSECAKLRLQSFCSLDTVRSKSISFVGSIT